VDVKVSYESRITDGLDAAFRRAASREISMDLNDVRWIIFSDQHRGGRGPGDRFARAERAYNAALGHYVEAGYTLLLLGDVEELWARRPGEVMRSYPYTLELESEFFVRGRYMRFFGNHDTDWSVESRTREHLWPFFPGLSVLESLRVRLTSQGSNVGTLFLAHGHQGSTFSDRHQRIARFAVRNFWRPVQRFFKSPGTTPAADFELRERHDRALYRWAASHEDLVLVAGHTHRPVFMSESLTRKVSRDLATARQALEQEPDSAESRQRVADLRAELEWIRTGSSRDGRMDRLSGNGTRPCYFNTGCCSFPDGDITGIEIVGGSIRLVRWPDRQRKPRSHVLATADLMRDVFARPKRSTRLPQAPPKTSAARLSYRGHAKVGSPRIGPNTNATRRPT
jgi:hypothetical protein